MEPIPKRAPAAPRPALFALTWPLFAEFGLGHARRRGGTLARLLLVRRFGRPAFSVANHVQATFFLLFRIISLGLSVVITQNLGAGNRKRRRRRPARAALGASVWMGVLTAVLVVALAAPLLGLLNAPAEVMPEALPYLRILALALGARRLQRQHGRRDARPHAHPRRALQHARDAHGAPSWSAGR